MMQQKLVTIFLHEPLERPTQRDAIQEHLHSYLSRGWRILQVQPCFSAAAGNATSATGWLAVLLGLPDSSEAEYGFSIYRERPVY